MWSDHECLAEKCEAFVLTHLGLESWHWDVLLTRSTLQVQKRNKLVWGTNTETEMKAESKQQLCPHNNSVFPNFRDTDKGKIFTLFQEHSSLRNRSKQMHRYSSAKILVANFLSHGHLSWQYIKRTNTCAKDLHKDSILKLFFQKMAWNFLPKVRILMS